MGTELGASNGSMYHRYPSRDHLLAELWLDAVERFQAMFVAALDGPEPEAAAAEAARSVLRWAREHTADVAILMQLSREDLLGQQWPSTVRDRVERARVQLEAALSSFEARAGMTAAGDRRRLRFMLVDSPYALIRRAMRERRVVDAVDEAIAAEVVAGSRCG